MPGHSSALCKSHPEICDKDCKETYNPITSFTYDFLSTFIPDWASYFQDKIIHLGGDEVPAKCWLNDPEIAAGLKERNYTTNDVFSYFVNQTFKFATDIAHKEVILWNEVWNSVGTKLPKDVII